jgi:predicted nucleotidyltransferase
MTLPLAVQQEIVRRLKPLEPAKVILFGSYAKGTATEESDIDLAVVVPGPVAKTYAEYLAQHDTTNAALRPLRRRYSMDILVFTTEECKKRKRKNDVFLNEIESTGELLYGR